MRLILVRHGESTANVEGIYSGWLDVRLTDKGVLQAKEIGEKISNIKIDKVYTSYLSRAIQSTYYILEQTDQLQVPVVKTWKLNGKHMGFLQGQQKALILSEYGGELANCWRVNYTVRPPKIDSESSYRGKGPKDILTESLADNYQRTVEVLDKILADSSEDATVLIVSHLHTIRCIMKYIEDISDEDIEQLIIPHGEIIDYHLIEESYYRKIGR